jgi:hypothetical protein
MARQSTGSTMIRDADSLSAARTCPKFVWWENGCGLVEKYKKRKSGRRVVGGRERLGWTWRFLEGPRAGLAITLRRLEGAMALSFGASFESPLKSPKEHPTNTKRFRRRRDTNQSCMLCQMIACCTGRVLCINSHGLV